MELLVLLLAAGLFGVVMTAADAAGAETGDERWRRRGFNRPCH